MEDKFILMGLGDENSKNIANIVGNPICKKILDFLAERKEASEKDISDGLGIKMNTLEYNLKKLVSSGLVEHSRNFFWSVKGKKIPMYKLARKHIIISNKKPDLNYIRSILPVILIAAILIVLFGAIFFQKPEIKGDKDYTQIKQFSSVEELKQFWKSNTEQSNAIAPAADDSISFSQATAGSVSAESGKSGAGAGESRDYSETNIQVEGADEADIVKNDGKYIYVLSGNKVSIINAYPPEEMKIISEIKLQEGYGNLFVNGNKLVIFSTGYGYATPYLEKSILCVRGPCGGYSEPTSNVYIYDISSKENPILERNISIDGSYADSRMIGDYVYLISSKYINNEPVLPLYRVNGAESSIPISDVYYFDSPSQSYTFVTVSSIKLSEDQINNKVYLTGGLGTIYVSLENIFLTYTKPMDYTEYAGSFAQEVALKILPASETDKITKILESDKDYYSKTAEMRQIIFDYSQTLTGNEKSDFDEQYSRLSENFEQEFLKKSEKTAVHKISIDNGEIEYLGAGEVSGHILNQFSMDEFDNYFRIATTTGDLWSGKSLNHIYVLDEDLKNIGSVENLAEGETIYSARFIGERAYLVTFKNIDPFYVVSLSNPEKPEVLGYLKIPGYSDYLHPYDENHIIGIGKEAVDESNIDSRNFAWYQGVKIALFDVTDVSNPIENAKFVIGDRGTDSIALQEHKAFLFDKEKSLLAIPITLAEINRTKYKQCSASELTSPRSYEYCLTPSTYGDYTWQGAYVLNIDLDEISLRGRISHFEELSSKYGPAKDESIGTTRKDASGNVWTKFEINNYGIGQWRTTAKDYENIQYSDYDVDYFPGGINYQFYFDYNTQIQRSLYMDDFLYTISNSKVKANNLADLSEIKKLELQL